MPLVNRCRAKRSNIRTFLQESLVVKKSQPRRFFVKFRRKNLQRYFPESFEIFVSWCDLPFPGKAMDDFEMDQSVDSNDFVMAELPFSVEDTPLLGRHLLAQRNLGRGELILCEKPTGTEFVSSLSFSIFFDLKSVNLGATRSNFRLGLILLI